jgi:predicted metal-dependent phosphoesterase TrpH
MKIRMQLKDPDGVSDSIQEAVEKSVAASGITDEDEREALIEARTEKAGKAIGKWVEYGEYLTVEFDTDAGTATVVPL